MSTNNWLPSVIMNLVIMIVGPLMVLWAGTERSWFKICAVGSWLTSSVGYVLCRWALENSTNPPSSTTSNLLTLASCVAWFGGLAIVVRVFIKFARVRKQQPG